MQSQSSDADAPDILATLTQAISDLLGEAPEGHLEAALRDALGTKRFLDDLSELYRTSSDMVADRLEAAGLRPFRPTPVVPSTTDEADAGNGGPESGSGWICAPEIPTESDFSLVALGPPFDERFPDPSGAAIRVEREWATACDRIHEGDPFLSFYREGVREHLQRYREKTSPRIHEYIQERFGADGLRYLVTVGIGANEQFWHYPSRWYDSGTPTDTGSGRIEWIIADNPKDLAAIPKDATSSNTLVVSTSRSGKTQEIVKFDEFLDPDVPRIVFANSGPLADLADREGALRLGLPDAIPGRFSKNLGPVVLVPLDILGLRFGDYWERIAGCIDRWDLTDPSSPPAALARYLRAAQLLHGANHIYLGTNDALLLGSCDELVQFWNEGVNKGSDFTMSRYFGLPRDSHLNIEGILANHATKTGIFVLRRGGEDQDRHPLQTGIRPINPAHAGLTVLDVDYALARANAEHFGSRMPTVIIEVNETDLLTSATLSQLWTDAVYLYSAMIGVNPGSNPEVRQVRDRSEALLAEFAGGTR